MPTIPLQIRASTGGITDTSVSILVDGLTYNAGTYYQIDLIRTDNGQRKSVKTSNGGNTSEGFRSGIATFTGLRPGTSYSFEAEIRYQSSSGITRLYAYIRTTGSEVTPPPSIPSVSVSSINGKNITFKITTGSNTTGYTLNTNWAGTFTNSASSNSTHYMSLTVPSFNSTYTVQVRGNNNSGSSSYSSWVYFSTGADNTPNVVSLTRTNGEENISFNWAVSNANNLSYFEVYISPPNTASTRLKATLSTASRGYTFTTDGAGNRFINGSTYYIQVRAYETNGNSSTASAYVNAKVSATRPLNFEWTSSKVSGGDFNVTSVEWNAFLNKINEFRVFKGHSEITTFDRAYSGNNFYAYQFNQAVNIINTLNPPISPPATRSSGDDIYASYFTRLRDSLNSVK